MKPLSKVLLKKLLYAYDNYKATLELELSEDIPHKVVVNNFVEAVSIFMDQKGGGKK